MLECKEMIETGEIEESISYFGHEFHFAFAAYDLHAEPFTFKKDIETKCKNFSTSWTLEFMFDQVPDSDITTCAITTRRTDSMNRPVTVNIELGYSYVKYPSIENEFLLTGDLNGGQEMLRFIDSCLPFPEENKMYLAGGITVQVRLGINCCDSN